METKQGLKPQEKTSNKIERIENLLKEEGIKYKLVENGSVILGIEFFNS